MNQIVDISALHAALMYLVALIVLFFVLTIAVIRARRGKQIGIGDGGDRALARLIRAHGNFTEACSIAIPAMLGVVFAGAGPPFVHVVGICLVAGRAAHATGLYAHGGTSVGRAAGMVLTFAALAVAAGVIVWKVVVG